MLTYLFQLTLCWGLFALLYRLLLQHETFFHTNRLYLLLTLLSGLSLPLMTRMLPVLATATDGEPGVLLPAVTVGLQQADEAVRQWTWAQALRWAWLLGIVVTGTRLLWGLGRLVGWAVRGQSERLADGCLLIRTTDARLPFSFFNWIFVPAPAARADDGYELMLAHERAHAHGRHSADVLLSEVVCVVFWWHPLAHWYRRALRATHEYLADAAAVSRHSKQQYGLLLIRQAQSGQPLAIANHFLQSPLKQRFIMLTKKASAPANRWKYGLALPLTALFALLFQQAPALAQQVADPMHVKWVRDLEARGWVSTDTVITFDPATAKESVQFVNADVAPKKDASGQLVYEYCDQQPEFPGGEGELFKYLGTNVKYPEDARQAKATETVFVNFVVKKDGSVSDIKTFAQQSGKFPSFEKEAARIVGAMPKWLPGKHRGKVVACRVVLPVKFKIE